MLVPPTAYATRAESCMPMVWGTKGKHAVLCYFFMSFVFFFCVFLSQGRVSLVDGSLRTACLLLRRAFVYMYAYTIIRRHEEHRPRFGAPAAVTYNLISTKLVLNKEGVSFHMLGNLAGRLSCAGGGGLYPKRF
ncbi:unnamed protein product [Ectocarpus sp. 8 AP-2014]